MVPTTIVHPNVVEGLETSLCRYPKNSWGNDMPIVSKVLSVEKSYSLKGGNSSRFIILCLVAIELVIKEQTNTIVTPVPSGIKV